MEATLGAGAPSYSMHRSELANSNVEVTAWKMMPSRKTTQQILVPMSYGKITSRMESDEKGLGKIVNRGQNAPLQQSKLWCFEPKI